LQREAETVTERTAWARALEESRRLGGDAPLYG
jgi:hypothetical protein